MRSPIYWHPLLYNFAMKLLYGKYFEARYRALADLIPVNASVAEVCAGDGYLYDQYLKQKNISYHGYDINPVFVEFAKKRKILFSIHDILKDNLPSADYVIIQASLYQFIPREHQILRKLLDAANCCLLVAEPVRNLADSNNSIVRMLARYSANPGSGHTVKRFTQDTLLACFKEYPEFQEVREIEGGRELIGVFKK